MKTVGFVVLMTMSFSSFAKPLVARNCGVHFENLVEYLNQDERSIFEVEKAFSKKGLNLIRAKDSVQEGDLVVSGIIIKNNGYHVHEINTQGSMLLAWNVGDNYGCEVSNTALISEAKGSSYKSIATIPFSLRYESGCNSNQTALEVSKKIVGEFKKCK